MSDKRHERDEELGAALRQLEVPEHRPDFMPTLMARLQNEAVTRAPGATWFDRWRRPLLMVATTAAVIVGVLAVSVVLPTSDSDRGPRIALGPRPVAADVRAQVSRAVAAATTLRGELIVTCRSALLWPCSTAGGGRTRARWSVAATAAGDERITGVGFRDDAAYNTRLGEYRAFGGDGPPEGVRLIGLAAGPPDLAAPPGILQRGYGSLVRAFLASTANVPVAEITLDGRAAWRLTVPVEPNKLAGPEASGDTLEVTVDRQTGFPLRLVESLAGRRLLEIRLSGLVVNAPLDPGTFTLRFPPGSRPIVQDVGFRPVPLHRAASVIGYRPLLPTALPPGFTLTAVAVARRTGPTGAEGINPPSRSVVSVAYRRGFDRIIVSNRATGPDPTAWNDPVATGEGFVDRPQRFTVRQGALSGARAQLVVTPRGIPHVWALNPQTLVTVAGDATPDELRRMIQSLFPVA